MMNETQREPVLELSDLRTSIQTSYGDIPAVNGVSFTLRSGASLGIVGESGCGKSVTSLSIMQLLPHPSGRIVDGSITYRAPDGETSHIERMMPNSKEIRAIRGREISMIFQEPMTSLNPVHTIGNQIGEMWRYHNGGSRKSTTERVCEILHEVGFSSPRKRLEQYPHELSGGLRQRAMIAMALVCSPRVVIADEPTTALDVTIEAQILDLMQQLQDRFSMSIILITHDLKIIGEMTDEVVVMYLGSVVERARTPDLFSSPAHPYTRGLLMSIPTIGRKTRLTPISGTVPSGLEIPSGCPFRDRCPEVMAVCTQSPPEVQVAQNHVSRCWLHAGERSP